MQGTLVIISAPSGGGKNAVVAKVLSRMSNAMRFVTTTTRPMRPGEAEGIDYYFIGETEFQKKMKRGDFVECNRYADHWYGTDRMKLEEAMKTHQWVFAVIDVNGRKSFVAKKIPHIAMFLAPDNMQTLRGRIVQRGGATDAEIEERLRMAEAEIAEADSFDYQVVNREGDIGAAVREIALILDKKELV